MIFWANRDFVEFYMERKPKLETSFRHKSYRSANAGAVEPDVAAQQQAEEHSLLYWDDSGKMLKWSSIVTPQQNILQQIYTRHKMFNCL